MKAQVSYGLEDGKPARTHPAVLPKPFQGDVASVQCPGPGGEEEGTGSLHGQPGVGSRLAQLSAMATALPGAVFPARG